MFKRFFVLAAIFLLFALGIYFFKKISFKRQAQKLNLILISADALRADRMGIYGYKKNTTPNIDRWAKSATVFTRAYTVAPITLPSFIALMTGRSPFTTNIIKNPIEEQNGEKKIVEKFIDDNTPTLAQILSKNGFITSAFVSNVSLFPELSNIDKGFDEYVTDEWRDTDWKGHEEFVNRAIHWLENNKAEKFFLWLHLLDPHEPYMPKDKDKCLFGEEFCDEIRAKSYKQLDDERRDIKGCVRQPISRNTVELYSSLYDGEVNFVDFLVGRVLDKIQSLGLEKNSLIIFYSDHGEGFDHNYYFTHSHEVYDSSTHIPLIIKYPFGNPKTTGDALISNLDLFPSVLEMLGLSSKELKFQGVSFANSFINKSTSRDVRPPILIANDEFTKKAIIDGNYKYIISDENTCHVGEDTEELYDLNKDHLEVDNIYKQKTSFANSLKLKLIKGLKNIGFNQIRNTEVKNVKSKEMLERLKSLGY